MPAAEIAVRFRWTYEVLAEATRWQLREAGRQPRTWSLWAVVAVGVGSTAAGIVLAQPAACAAGLFVAAFALFLRWAGPRGLARRLRRRYAASRLCDREIEWRITEAAVRIRDPYGSADLTWGAFVRCVHTPGGMMFYLQPDLLYWLPRAAFATEAEFGALADLARRQVAAYRELR